MIAPTVELPIRHLLCAAAFPHATSNIRLIETHISWVILTGKFAYKIKKPVNLGFVDYSTLDRRRHFCQLEVERNRPFAPEIYLEVVPIVQRGGQLEILTGSTDLTCQHQPIEYAVRMTQFPQDAIVASRLNNPQLNAATVERFGRRVAQRHQSAPAIVATESWDQPSKVTEDAIDNLTVLQNKFKSDKREAIIKRLETWTIMQSKRLTSKFLKRYLQLRIHQCHGDLHLKNIVQLDGELFAFDGIEFNEEFQNIDLLNEIAFPVMDFLARGRSDLAWRLLNAYLESTGDYEDLDVLRFYLVYRALVRAKVTCLSPKNTRPNFEGDNDQDNQHDKSAGPWDKYLVAAQYFAFEQQPKLTITHGFSGSGKSTTAMLMIENSGGIRIRSDVERHRLAKTTEFANEYSESMTRRVYDRLDQLTLNSLHAQFPTVVDATFLSQPCRARYRKIAEDHSIDFRILNCSAPYEELCARIRHRGSDPSEATIDVLQFQMATHDPLTAEELEFASTPQVLLQS